MTNKLTIAYAAGPGDVVQTFKHWQHGTDDPHQVAITYAGQFFDLCTSLGAKGIVLSSNPRADMVKTESFHIENIPVGPPGRGGVFHYRQVKKSAQFLHRARQLGADVFIISDATGHWFPVSLLKRNHEKIIPTLHCVLWSRFHPKSLSRRLLNRLERSFFRNICSGILYISPEVGGQVKEIAGKEPGNMQIFHPVYRDGIFSSLAPPEIKVGRPFNVFFAGRLEAEKGVFDLLEIAKRLKAQGRIDIHFKILGDGGAEKSLRKAAATAQLDSMFQVFGYCERPELMKVLGDSHVIIVPTSTRFHEGFNKVVAEGVMSGRPVITSSACPALNFVRGAVVEVAPDDIKEYEKAIRELRDNLKFYKTKQGACFQLADQFYDKEMSWQMALERVLRHGGASGTV